MQIIETMIPKAGLSQIEPMVFPDMIKGVVDVGRSLLAVNAELHADLEAMLLESGSRQKDLWGINLYPDMDEEDFLEFDSLINIRPGQGNRSRGVEDPAIQQKIREVVAQWITQ